MITASAAEISIQKSSIRYAAMRYAAIGAGLGFCWGAGLRGWMAVFAGTASEFSWNGTFTSILAPAALAGAILGWAEHARRTNDTRARRFTTLVPMIFVVVPAVVMPDFIEQLRTGLGTGAIGIALIGSLGGFAIGGKGPRWAIMLARTFFALILAGIAIGTLVTLAREGSSTPKDAYLLLTLVGYSALFAQACAISYLPSLATPQDALSQE